MKFIAFHSMYLLWSSLLLRSSCSLFDSHLCLLPSSSPSLLPSSSLPSAAGPTCQLYSGSLCYGYGSIGMDQIYINTSVATQDAYEAEMNEFRTTIGNFSPQCQEVFLEFMCVATFPSCDLSHVEPRPHKVCFVLNGPRLSFHLLCRFFHPPSPCLSPSLTFALSLSLSLPSFPLHYSLPASLPPSLPPSLPLLTPLPPLLPPSLPPSLSLSFFLKVCRSYCERVHEICEEDLNNLFSFSNLLRIDPLVIPDCSTLPEANGGDTPECYTPVSSPNVTEDCKSFD